MMTEMPEETDHATILMFKLEGMRQRKFICDFTIKVGNKSLAVHRLVLAACSDYFEAMFANDMKENREGFVELNGMDAAAVTNCIEMMYTGKATLILDGIGDVFQVADMIQFPEMTSYCVKFLEKNISVKNCLQVRAITEAFSLTKTMTMADQFVVEYFHEISQTHGFRDLGVNEVIELMKRSREETQILLKAAMSWMKGPHNKKESFLEILRNLQLDNCSFEFLFTTVWKEDIISQSKGCQNLVASSLLKSFNFGDVTTDNCIDVLQLAKSYGHECRKGTVGSLYGFISKNFECVAKQPQFNSLDFLDVVGVYGKLGIAEKVHEDAVYMWIYVKAAYDDDDIETAWWSAMSWIKHLKDKRAKFLLRLLKNFKLETIRVDVLLRIVLKEPLVKESEICKEFVISCLFTGMIDEELELENWFTFLKLSKKYDKLCPSHIVDLILKFITENFQIISLQENFLHLSSKVLFDVLKSQAVKVCQIDIKWEAVLRWVKKDVKTRKQHLSNLLKLISLERMSHDFIKNNIFSEALVKEDNECKNIIIEALFAKAPTGR